MELKDDSLATKFRIKISTPSLSRPGREEGVVPTMDLQKVRGAYELSVAPSAIILFAVGKQTGDGASIYTTVPAVGLGKAGGDPNGTKSRWTPPVFSLAGASQCDMNVPDSLPDQAHTQMDLTNAPDLPGFENGFQCSSALDCSNTCADQRSPDGWHRLACQAWLLSRQAQPVRARMVLVAWWPGMRLESGYDRYVRQPPSPATDGHAAKTGLHANPRSRTRLLAA